jgi:hypothetical protein
MEAANWVLYDSYNDYFKANVMLGKLQSEGFVAMLKDENTVTMDPMLGNAIGGIKVMVLQKDTEAIVALAKKWKQELLVQQICPNCNAGDIEIITTQKPENWLLAITTWFFSGFAVAKTNYQCNACKKQFKI